MTQQLQKYKTDFEIQQQREQYLQKPLPSDPDAERVVLGAILLDNDLMPQAFAQNVSSEDFYSPLHRRIFKAMTALFERGERIDPILIGNELKKETAIETIGGIATITHLTYGLPHFSGIEDYCKIIKEKSVTRNFIKACGLAMDRALAEDEEVFQIIDVHEQNVFDLRRLNQTGGFVPSGKIAIMSIEKIKAQAAKGNALTGLSTGFADLNEKTSGMQESDLIIVAARPSMGKTSIAIDIAINATDDDPQAVVAVFSLESSKEEISLREVTQIAKVDNNRYRNAMLSREEWTRIGNAIGALEDKKIFVDDTPGQSVLEMQAKARTLFAEQKRIDLIIIDHLGHIRGSGRKERTVEVGEITKALKAMAKMFKCPVMVLCQLNRKCETRNPPRPMLSDLFESGNIEQDADCVWLLYREAYYANLRTPDNEKLAELIIAKARNAPTGVVKLYWQDFCTHFENWKSV